MEGRRLGQLSSSMEDMCSQSRWHDDIQICVIGRLLSGVEPMGSVPNGLRNKG